MFKRLQQGNPAPNFQTLTLDGTTLSLPHFRGQLVWLMFYRYPGCPLCNLHMSSLLIRRDKWDEYKLNLLIVFESSARKFPEGFSLNRIPRMFFIADPTQELYSLYNVENRLGAVFRPGVVSTFLKAMFSGYRQGPILGNLGRVPAHFLIDEKGIIRNAYYGKHIGDHIPFPEVENFLAQRKMGDFDLALPVEA